jgi:hypothetical protein
VAQTLLSVLVRLATLGKFNPSRLRDAVRSGAETVDAGDMMDLTIDLEAITT